MIPTESQKKKMLLYPNEMLWNKLNEASHYPDKNISWLQKCQHIIETKPR